MNEKNLVQQGIDAAEAGHVVPIDAITGKSVAARVQQKKDREAWLAERRKGLGGSDAAAALGFSPYKTPYDLYREKRGEVPDEDLSDNNFVEWGTRLEDVVADAYADKTGEKVHRVNQMLKHPEHPWMIANLDRRIVGGKRGLEIKTANAWAARDDETWGPSGTDQVPAHYLFQCAHYMAVTGYESFDLAVLMGGNDFRIYTIPRKEAFITVLIEREAEFWQRVQDGNPPSAKTMDDVRSKFARHVKETWIPANEEITTTYHEYLGVCEDIKAMKPLLDRKEELQITLGDYMGTNEMLVVGEKDVLSFRTQSTGKRIPASFKDAEPDTFAKYAVEGTTRIMRFVSEKKKK